MNDRARLPRDREQLPRGHDQPPDQEPLGDDDFYGTSYLLNARGAIAAEARRFRSP